MKYTVRYKITEIEADDPVEAALCAEGLMNQGLKVFTVLDEDSNDEYMVDTNPSCNPKDRVIKI